MSEWREYWTPNEYADMCEVLTPEQLEEEIARMRAKAEHYRIAAEMGFDPEEAAGLRILALAVMGSGMRFEEERSSGDGSSEHPPWWCDSPDCPECA